MILLLENITFNKKAHYLLRKHECFIQKYQFSKKVNHLLRKYHFVDRNISFLSNPPPPRQPPHQNPAWRILRTSTARKREPKGNQSGANRVSKSSSKRCNS